MGPPCVCQIREEIEHFGIKIYQFPDCDSDEDEDFKLQDQALKVWPRPASLSHFVSSGQNEEVEFYIRVGCLGWERTLVSSRGDENIGGKEQVRMRVGGDDRHPKLLPGKHPICCNWQQHCGRGQRATSQGPSLPLGHRGR